MCDLFVEPIVGGPEQLFFSWLDEISMEWLRSSFTTSPNFLAWSPLNRTGAVHNHRFKCQTPLLGEHHLQSFSPKNNRSYPTAGPRTLPISQVAPAPRTVGIEPADDTLLVKPHGSTNSFGPERRERHSQGYLPGMRYSKDPDFSCETALNENQLHADLSEILEATKAGSGVQCLRHAR